jgi:hypothetical protein
VVEFSGAIRILVLLHKQIVVSESVSVTRRAADRDVDKESNRIPHACANLPLVA